MLQCRDSILEEFESGQKIWADMTESERSRLVQACMPQVYSFSTMAYRQAPEDLEMDDVVSAGCLGLVQALKRFTPGQGFKVRSYTGHRVQGAILDDLRKADVLPRSARQLVRELGIAIAGIERKKLGSATEEDILALNIFSKKYVREGFRAMRTDSFVSLEDLHMDKIFMGRAQTCFPDPCEACFMEKLGQKVRPLLEKLTVREKQAVDLYYVQGMTMREAAVQMGVVECRVHQILTRAASRLRELLEK